MKAKQKTPSNQYVTPVSITYDGKLSGFTPMNVRHLVALAIISASGDGVSLAELQQRYKKATGARIGEHNSLTIMRQMEQAGWIEGKVIYGDEAKVRQRNNTTALRVNVTTEDGDEALDSFVDVIKPLLIKRAERYAENAKNENLKQQLKQEGKDEKKG